MQGKMKTFDLECHCGNLKLSANEAPDSMTSCNCSICNRLGAQLQVLEDLRSIPFQAPLQSLDDHPATHCVNG